MSTTATLERIDLVVGSEKYRAKLNRAPRHLSTSISDDEDRLSSNAPKHRKEHRPKHLRWVIEQY